MSIERDDKDKMEQLSSAADIVTRLGAGLGLSPAAREAPPAALEQSQGDAKPAAAPALTGLQIVNMAKEQITMLTGLSSSTVSGLFKDEKGWHVVLDLVELRRIPSSSDVLATYDVLLDPHGTLLSYRRTRRYYRGSTEVEI